MGRCAHSLILACGCGLFALAGCANMLETRVISAFAADFHERDMAGLKKNASEDFDKKALQRTDVDKMLDAVELPKGKIKVTKVQPVDGDPNRKRVVAAIGEKKNIQRVVFELHRDDNTQMWKVDDLFLSNKDISSNSSIAEQLHIVAAVRNFHDAWKTAKPESMVTVCTKDLKKSLSIIPEAHQSALATKLLTDVADSGTMQPETTVTGDLAEAKIPRGRTFLMVRFERADETWKVRDLAIEDRRGEEAMPSLRNHVTAIKTGLTWHAAYHAGNKDDLKATSAPVFYESCLSTADLNLVQIPQMPADPGEMDVQLSIHGGSIVFRDTSAVLKISLCRHSELSRPVVPVSATEDEELDDHETLDGPLQVLTAKDIDLTAPTEYRVENVSLYEINGTQHKRLSALFTAHDRVKSYCQALVTRDLDSLRTGATKDFASRVWDPLNSVEGRKILAELPLNGITVGRTKIVTSMFRGSVTSVLVEQGGNPLTVILRDQNGHLLVDDVQTPPVAGPESLKLACEMAIPAIQFGKAYAGFSSSQKMEMVQSLRNCCSREFCRVVWMPIDHRYSVDATAIKNLTAPIQQISLAGDRATVRLGTQSFGAQVKLLREQNRFVVDDVTIVSGVEVAARSSLKQSLRTKIADIPVESLQSNREVLHAAAEIETPDSAEVQTATLDTSEPARLPGELGKNKGPTGYTRSRRVTDGSVQHAVAKQEEPARIDPAGTSASDSRKTIDADPDATSIEWSAP